MSKRESFADSLSDRAVIAVTILVLAGALLLARSFEQFVGYVVIGYALAWLVWNLAGIVRALLRR